MRIYISFRYDIGEKHLSCDVVQPSTSLFSPSGAGGKPNTLLLPLIATSQHHCRLLFFFLQTRGRRKSEQLGQRDKLPSHAMSAVELLTFFTLKRTNAYTKDGDQGYIESPMKKKNKVRFHVNARGKKK